MGSEIKGILGFLLIDESENENYSRINPDGHKAQNGEVILFREDR